MVQYLILGVALLVAVILIARWFESANPSRLAKVLKWGFLGLGGLLAIYFGVTGKIQLAMIPLALTFLPLLIRGMRGAAAARRRCRLWHRPCSVPSRGPPFPMWSPPGN